MNRYTRRNHGYINSAHNWLKTIDLASVSAADDGASVEFNDQPGLGRPARQENLYMAEPGQKLDSKQLSAPLTAAPGSVPRRPSQTQPDDNPAEDTHGPSVKAAQQTGRSGGARKSAASRRQSAKSPNQKHQRAAEARQRYELLEEERELMDNVADFWDERFDKPRRRRVPLPPWDAHKNYPPPAESDGEEAEQPSAPRNRSSRR